MTWAFLRNYDLALELPRYRVYSSPLAAVLLAGCIK